MACGKDMKMDKGCKNCKDEVKPLKVKTDLKSKYNQPKQSIKKVK